MSEGPNNLTGFARVGISIAGEPWTVAVADTPVLRAQGLMGVTDLQVDGMLFVFENPVQVSFHMQDTLIPLDIAFFDETGVLVDQFTMTPCSEVPCPTYPAAGPVVYAIETRVGGFDELGPLALELPNL